MKFISSAILLAGSATLCGCASVIEGTTQSVAVTTPPVTGASCTLANSEGTWYLMTPGNATVHKTKTDLKLLCTKPGYKDATNIVSPHFNGATLGNVIAGGVIGIGVDAATGANFNYPQDIAVPMTPIAAGSDGKVSSQSDPASSDSAPFIGTVKPQVDMTLPHSQPPYPEGAQARGEQGTVTVDVYVRPSGKPERARISQSSGFEDLDTAAIQGVLNWRFIPAKQNRDPVSDWTTVKVVYQLPAAPTPQLPASSTGANPK